MNIDVKKYRSYKRWFIYHLYKQKYLVLCVIIGITILTLTRTLIPIVIGNIIDNLFLTQDQANLMMMVSIGLSLYLFRNAMDYITMMAGHNLGLKTEQNMRKEFFDTIQLKPLRYYDSARTGDLQALATNDLRVINTMVSHGSFYIYPFFQVVMTMLLLFEFLDFRLALISTPFILLYIYFILYYRKKISPYASARLRKHSNLAVVLQDSITGAAVVRSFTAEKMEREKFSKAVYAFRDNWIGETKVQSKYYPMLVLYIAIGTTFLVSCVFVFQNTLTIGDLAAINLLLITLIDPTNVIFWATNDMMSGFAACSRLYIALSREESEHSNDTFNEWSNKFKGKIEFKNVTFAYRNGDESNPPVLKNLTFTIEPYQRVALVGPTGCGKTTLVKLLLRLYEPQKGTILLDGVDIRDYPLQILRRHIGYIEQDIYLFSRSINENIAFGKQNATLKDIIDVAKLAQVDEFVQEFPKKYNTIVGERGTRLSGGEKQRVAIARAFLTNPEIIILDDSVSAVDSETEEKIGRAMENILKNRTTLIITHRLHTIRTSDKIIVLKHGKIVAEGNHNNLLQSSEDYRRIFGKHLLLPKLTIKKAYEVEK
ncbi:MAG: ABC transporter ATP-binding protein [Candidatus Lokiarchaeota archaeon]|nr:ABC transporter ATP-binding protein [Candidatus Lokiarchaeota archaeon]